MLEFHLDTRSGVAPYQQIVQQVRNALRLGFLDVDDQLPTVKEVVAAVAINPNTVLKAYKELEHLGLVAARPGIGTFVIRTLTDDSLAAHGPLRQDLMRWLEKARRGARRGEHRGALSRRPLVHLRRRRSVTAVVEASGLGKRYGHMWALSDCTLAIPAGKVVGLVGPNGAGKTTLSSSRSDSFVQTLDRSLSSVGNLVRGRAGWPVSASSPRTPPPMRDCRFAITCASAPG